MLKLHLTKGINEKDFLFFILYFVAFFGIDSFAQSIEITKSSDQKISISIQDFVIDSNEESIIFFEVQK